MEKKRAVPIRRASFRAIAYEARLRVETMGGGEVAAVKGVGGAGRICFRTIFSVPPSKGVGRQE